PSSTAEPAGSSRDRARSPNGTRPDGVDAARGGANTTFASPSAAGNRLRDGGASGAQPAESPRTSSANSSTTVPVLRTLMATVTVEPGSTATAGVTSWPEPLTGGSVTTGGRGGEGPVARPMVLSGRAGQAPRSRPEGQRGR